MDIVGDPVPKKFDRFEIAKHTKIDSMIGTDLRAERLPGTRCLFDVNTLNYVVMTTSFTKSGR